MARQTDLPRLDRDDGAPARMSGEPRTMAQKPGLTSQGRCFESTTAHAELRCLGGPSRERRVVPSGTVAAEGWHGRCSAGLRAPDGFPRLRGVDFVTIV